MRKYNVYILFLCFSANGRRVCTANLFSATIAFTPLSRAWLTTKHLVLSSMSFPCIRPTTPSLARSFATSRPSLQKQAKRPMRYDSFFIHPEYAKFAVEMRPSRKTDFAKSPPCRFAKTG